MHQRQRRASGDPAAGVVQVRLADAEAARVAADRHAPRGSAARSAAGTAAPWSRRTGRGAVVPHPSCSPAPRQSCSSSTPRCSPIAATAPASSARDSSTRASNEDRQRRQPRRVAGHDQRPPEESLAMHREQRVGDHALQEAVAHRDDVAVGARRRLEAAARRTRRPDHRRGRRRRLGLGPAAQGRASRWPEGTDARSRRRAPPNDQVCRASAAVIRAATNGEAVRIHDIPKSANNGDTSCIPRPPSSRAYSAPAWPRAPGEGEGPMLRTHLLIGDESREGRRLGRLRATQPADRRGSASVAPAASLADAEAAALAAASRLRDVVLGRAGPAPRPTVARRGRAGGPHAGLRGRDGRGDGRHTAGWARFNVQLAANMLREGRLAHHADRRRGDPVRQARRARHGDPPAGRRGARGSRPGTRR